MAAREKFNCLSGATHKTRKGWDKDLMNLDTKSDRGTCKPAYDKENEILIGQWNDDKVVNFCSSVNEIGLGTIRRQVGSEKKEFPCPLALVQCQKNMFGIDKGDQMRAHNGGFSDHVHFKKWHEKVHLATLDCGLLNARIAWNMSADNRSF